MPESPRHPEPNPESKPEYTRSVAEVATELTHLAGHLTVGMYRLIVLVGEFDARRGWAREGSQSCAEWLGWKCGVAGNTAREQVRVAAALPKLPLIEAAFARGEVSYSKVRAMTRVATPENEDRLLNYGLHGTTAHVETLCRLVRRQDEAVALDAQLAAHANRECRWRVERDGSVTLRATLPPELGATVIKALEAAQKRLRDSGPELGAAPAAQNGPASAGAPEPADAAAGRRSRSGASPASDGGDSFGGCDDCSSASTREVRPLAARRADALVHVAEAFLSNPSSDTARADERYQVVVRVSAETLRCAAFGAVGESDANDHASLDASDDGHEGRYRPDHGHNTRHDAESAPFDGHDLLQDTDCHIEGISAVPAETARRIACDACVVKLGSNEAGDPLDLGRRSRQLSPALRRALQARDRSCRFPGCGCRRWVEAHHIVHWADGGRTSLDNLVGLCRHHHRLVHEAGYGIAFDQQGRTVATTPEGDVLRESAPMPEPGTTRDLFADNAAAGANVEADTVVPDWHGDAPDYSVTLQVLANRARRRSAPSNVSDEALEAGCEGARH